MNHSRPSEIHYVSVNLNNMELKASNIITLYFRTTSKGFSLESNSTTISVQFQYILLRALYMKQGQNTSLNNY